MKDNDVRREEMVTELARLQRGIALLDAEKKHLSAEARADVARYRTVLSKRKEVLANTIQSWGPAPDGETKKPRRGKRRGDGRQSPS